MRPEYSRAARAVPRRRFLTLTGGAIAAVAIGAACGDDDDKPSGNSRSGTATASSSPATSGTKASTGTVVVGDVMDHALTSEKWKGEFGFVTFRLHTGLIDGQKAYFIRTDASDKAFADKEKLVYVPLLSKAVASGAGLSSIYLFDKADQPAVLSSTPDRPNFSPAFRVHRVTSTAGGEKFESEQAILAAQQAGRVRVERTDTVVNYPVVKWPGGELPHDTERVGYLGGGQLLEPVDVAGGKVMFKLHACYPATRYIVTDVTMAEMAAGMKIAPAPGAAGLTAAGATAKILVFGNGQQGSGPMGFQKSVTDSVVGDATWSPYWDHYTFVWKDPSNSSILKSQGAVSQQESSGSLQRFSGTPDTKGQLFMVNCPVPVVAPVA